MRKLAGIWVLLLCVCAVSSAQPRAIARRSGQLAAALSTLQSGMSPVVRQRLAGTITPQQQMAAIMARPELMRRISALKDAEQDRPLDPIWLSGITLTPLDATYPAGSDYAHSSLALRTEAAFLSQMTPLPTADQSPPLLWLNASGNSAPLLWIEARWPKRGAYLITFLLKDVWPDSPATPRVRVNGVMQEPIQYPPGDVAWTVVCLAEDSDDLYQSILVYPEATGYGYMLCCLSKVVISKIWLE